MARPRKDSVDYFPHFVNWGKTIPILESRYGNDGYSVWFKILESIGKAAGHFIDCSDPMEWEFLVQKLRVSDDTATEILDLLCKLGTIDRELWQEDRVIWCQNFVDHIADVYTKRRVSAPEKPALRSFRTENPAQTEVPVAETRQSTAQHSIAQHSKEKEPAEAASPPAAPPSTQEPKWTKRDMEKAVLLRDQILATDPSYVHGANDGTMTLEKWADEFRLIRERDKRSEEDVGFILSHFPGDEFWSTNIRSPGALRGLTNKTRKDKFLTILASVKQSVNGKPRTNGQSNGRTYSPNPEEYEQLAAKWGIGNAGQNASEGAIPDSPVREI